MVREVEATLKGQLKLGPGSTVQVHGLKNQTELNGLHGHLLQFDAAKLRWGVQLSDGKQVSLKMGNFLPVDMTVTPCQPPSSTGVQDATCEKASSDSAGYVQPLVNQADATVADAAPLEACVEDTSAPKKASTSDATRSDCTEETPEGDATEKDVIDKTKIVETDATQMPNAEEDWPVLPTSAAVAEKMRSGCWFDGGSAAKRFTEQLAANDSTLISVCLVPPKRFDDSDAEQICTSLEGNDFCQELVASGHQLSAGACERLAQMLSVNKALKILSIGDSSLGDNASILFSGLAKNTSLASLDLEHKGLTAASCKALAQSFVDRQSINAAKVTSLKLSRNTAITGALAELAAAPASAELFLCECALGADHGASIGRWTAQGVVKLDLRDNSALGAQGLENLLEALLPKKGLPTPALRTLRLDGCAIGDDGMEVIADAYSRGLQLEELFVERCEITKDGCRMLADALRGERLQTLSARSNVIGDEGCTLLGLCSQRLDLSSTSLSGQVLTDLGKQPLVALELFSNPSLGPSVTSWCAGLDHSEWQQLEHLDLSGCNLQDQGFECVLSALLDSPKLMPALNFLCLGANNMTEDDAKCVRVEELGTARNGKLKVVWQSA